MKLHSCQNKCAWQTEAQFAAPPRRALLSHAGRISAAIEILSVDATISVKQPAADLGYASVLAFSHAFRQVTGKTLTEFGGKE